MSRDPRLIAKGVFNFFDLPAELRDAIYEQSVLVEQCRLQRAERKYKYRMILYRPRLALRLVSRRFSAEYLSRCSSTVLYAQHQDFSEYGPFRLPLGTQTITDWEARVTINCDYDFAPTELETLDAELRDHH